MCLISVPNLKEIHLGKDCFLWLKIIVLNGMKKKNVKKIGQFLEMHILQTAYWIFAQCCIQSHVYGGHKICKFIEIGLVVIEIWGIKSSDLAVPVNNTLVCYTSFLATDTWPCLDTENSYRVYMIFIRINSSGSIV